MAQAELNITIDKLSGKIYGDSDVYIAHRYGKTVISHYPRHRDPKNITPHQRELSVAFGQVSKQAKAEMSDPVRHAYWQARYDEYRRLAAENLAKANAEFFGETNGVPNVPADKYYVTLRGFVIGQLRIDK